MNIYIINQYATLMPINQSGRHWFLSKGLSNLGHRVLLITANWHHLVSENDNIEVADNLIKSEIEIESIFIPVWKYSHARSIIRILNWFLFAVKIALLPYNKEFKPNVIIYSSPSLIGYLGAEILARRLRCKLIFEVRDIWPLTLMELGGYSKSNPFIYFLQLIEDRAYQKSDHVVSNLPFAVNHMTTRGMSANKFTWIPNGVSVDENNYINDLPPEIDSLIPKNKFLICYAGTLGFANSIESLLDAAELLKQNCDISFLIVGRGSEEKNLKARVKIKNLDNVVFLGHVSKHLIPSILSKVTVCYLGLKSDPLFRFGVSPNKLFEYFLAAKPVIYAIDSGEYRPVEAFRAGIHIAPENPSELKDAILRLKRLSQDELMLMGISGYSNVIKHNNYEQLSIKLDKVLSI